MGILDGLRKNVADVATVGLASPLRHDNHLEAVKWAGLIDPDSLDLAVTRSTAMKIPSVVRGRGLIVTTIARTALTATRSDGQVVPLSWIDRTDGELSAFHRMLWTADDLLFYGWSLWSVDRDVDGRVIRADRIPIGQWEFSDDGDIAVNGQLVDDSSVVLIPGIHEGVLTMGNETLRQARGLLRSADRAATMPAAMVELSQTSDYPMTDHEVDKLIDRWAQARRSQNGGVAFTSYGVESKEHGSNREHLLTEGRAASAVDIARLLGIPASMIDAQQAGTSMSYSNTSARMAELVSFGIAPMMAAIQARLSQDDITPRGTTLSFDMSTIVVPGEDQESGE